MCISKQTTEKSIKLEQGQLGWAWFWWFRRGWSAKSKVLRMLFECGKQIVSSFIRNTADWLWPEGVV